MSQMPALARSDAAAMPATARSTRRPSAPARPARSHLRVVTAAPRPARRMPFIVLCSGVLAAGLLAVLFLNMQLARGSYALHDLQRQSTILAEQQEALTDQVAAIAAPGVLAQRATELGLVPGTSPAFLRLPDGQVLGVPQAAATAPGQTGAAERSSSASPSASASSPSASASATPSASASRRASESSSQSSSESSSRPSSERSASAGAGAGRSGQGESGQGESNGPAR